MKFLVICYVTEFVDYQAVYAWLDEVHLTKSGYLKGWGDRTALNALEKQRILYEILY